MAYPAFRKPPFTFNWFKGNIQETPTVPIWCFQSIFSLQPIQWNSLVAGIFPLCLIYVYDFPFYPLWIFRLIVRRNPIYNPQPAAVPLASCSAVAFARPWSFDISCSSEYCWWKKWWWAIKSQKWTSLGYRIIERILGGFLISQIFSNPLFWNQWTYVWAGVQWQQMTS